MSSFLLYNYLDCAVASQSWCPQGTHSTNKTQPELNSNNGKATGSEREVQQCSDLARASLKAGCPCDICLSSKREMHRHFRGLFLPNKFHQEILFGQDGFVHNVAGFVGVRI